MAAPHQLVEQAFAAYARDGFAEAERLCASAIAADNAQFDAYHPPGVIAARQARYPEALAHFDQALALRPAAAPVQTNRGNALHSLGHFDEALESYEQALALQPDDLHALTNRGNTLFALNRPAAALRSYDRALALQPSHVAALANRGTALFALNRLDEALASYDRALAAQPDLATCHFNRAMALLLLGRFAAGWPEYEWRRRLWAPRDHGVPEWRGEDLAGQRLLLQAEDPIGDTIQFARFAPLLAGRAAQVMLGAPRRLTALLRSLTGPVDVVADGEAAPAADLQLPLGSVPAVLGLAEAEIPAEIPYLRADPSRVERWAQRLPAGGFRIGICWQGNPRRVVDRGRSIPLQAFAPLARLPGVRLISLQKGDGVEQLVELAAGMRMEQLGEDFDSGEDAFLDTAAVMMHLDLVITCDTAAVHLAGALGRPVWLVLRDVPVDWRWMLGREDSPWYPTIRLFRQRQRGDWDEVFARMARELAGLVRRD